MSGADHPPATLLNIACLSHLGWDRSLFQRPHHIMQRLAARGHHVSFYGCVGRSQAQQLEAAGNAQGDLAPAAPHPGRFSHLPYHPTTRRFRALQEAWVARTIRRDFHGNQPGWPVVVLYHPSLYWLAKRSGLLPDGPDHQGRRTILMYDIMDRFSAFEKGALDSSFDEEVVLTSADLIIAGGHSLRLSAVETMERVISGDGGRGSSAQIPRCTNVLSVPSGVDLSHFGKALTQQAIDETISGLPRPVYGYFGAIDERIDWDLLGRLAAAEPRGSIVLVGPVLRRPDVLPNGVHLVGARPYSGLPSVLRAFDVCLIPFVESKLTAHVSPTKAPEYLAGGKPVVSTYVPDVAADWGDVISVCRTPEEFTSACMRASVASKSPEDFAASAQRARSWDDIAQLFEAEIVQAAERARGKP